MDLDGAEGGWEGEKKRGSAPCWRRITTVVKKRLDVGAVPGTRGASRDSHLRVELLDAEILERGRPGAGGGLGDRARGLGACAEIQTVRCDVGKDVALGCSTAARDPGAARRPRPAGPEKTRVDRVDRRPRRVSTSNPRPGGARGSSSGHTDSRGGAPRVREKVFVMLGARRTHPSSRRRRPGRGARGRRARARRRARRRRRRGRARRAQRGRR